MLEQKEPSLYSRSGSHMPCLAGLDCGSSGASRYALQTGRDGMGFGLDIGVLYIGSWASVCSIGAQMERIMQISAYRMRYACFQQTSSRKLDSSVWAMSAACCPGCRFGALTATSTELQLAATCCRYWGDNPTAAGAQLNVRASWVAGHAVWGPALLSLVRLTPNQVSGLLRCWAALRPSVPRTSPATWWLPLCLCLLAAYKSL
jgi:hypothetical protein